MQKIGIILSVFFAVYFLEAMDTGKMILEKLAAMKAQTHRTLAKTKDISALMERVDRDLMDLDLQKRDAADVKKFLLEKKQQLIASLKEKIDLFQKMRIYNDHLKIRIAEERELITIFEHQKSILKQNDSVAELVSRDNLLSLPFVAAAVTQVPRSYKWIGIVEDVRG